MYKYKLTRRGKAVVFVSAMIIFIIIGTGVQAVCANLDVFRSETYPVADSPKSADPSDTPSSAVSPDTPNSSQTPDAQGIDTLMISPEELPSYLDKKIVFITFDDGPSEETTPQILDILAQYDVKATFFELGVNAEKNPSIVQDIYNSGHAIGLHTYSHKYKYLYTDIDNFKYEFQLSEEIFRNILGDQFKTRLFRFPGGSFKISDSIYKNYVKEEGYISIDWNTITGDGESSKYNSQELLDRTVATAKGRNHLTILMHDSIYKQSTVDALPSIIEYFKSQGYVFAIYK